MYSTNEESLREQLEKYEQQPTEIPTFNALIKGRFDVDRLRNLSREMIDVIKMVANKDTGHEANNLL